jgi:hypothetical protein
VRLSKLNSESKESIALNPEHLGAARHTRERLGGNENSAMIIERPFSVEGATRNILNQFAISLKNGPVGTGKMYAVGMISQRLVAHPARHSVTVLIRHQKPNAVLFEEFLLEAREGHRSILSCCQDYQTF